MVHTKASLSSNYMLEKNLKQGIGQKRYSWHTVCEYYNTQGNVMACINCYPKF